MGGIFQNSVLLAVVYIPLVCCFCTWEDKPCPVMEPPLLLPLISCLGIARLGAGIQPVCTLDSSRPVRSIYVVTLGCPWMMLLRPSVIVYNPDSLLAPPARKILDYVGGVWRFSTIARSLSKVGPRTLSLKFIFPTQSESPYVRTVRTCMIRMFLQKDVERRVPVW